MGELPGTDRISAAAGRIRFGFRPQPLPPALIRAFAGMALAAAVCLSSACSGRFGPPPGDAPTATAPPAPAAEEASEVPATQPASPSPPRPAETPPPAETPTPSIEPSETPTPFPITLEFSPTPSPTPFPLSEIEILAPGPLSKVVTPLHLSAVLVPGAGGKVRVELLGEDGRLLGRFISQHTTNPNQRVNVVMDLDFEIEAVAETGTLALSVDDGFGRTTDLASVEVILLGAGLPDINPGGDQLAPIVILDPKPGGLAGGGELFVSGLARTDSALPLVVELVSREGTVLGSRQVVVDEGPVEGYRPFSAIVPFTVSESIQVLLVVRERSDRFFGDTHITSQEIVVSP